MYKFFLTKIVNQKLNENYVKNRCGRGLFSHPFKYHGNALTTHQSFIYITSVKSSGSAKSSGFALQRYRDSKWPKTHTGTVVLQLLVFGLWLCLQQLLILTPTLNSFSYSYSLTLAPNSISNYYFFTLFYIKVPLPFCTAIMNWTFGFIETQGGPPTQERPPFM